MTFGFTACLLGPLVGLGFPELVVIAVIIMVIVFVSRAVSGRNTPARFRTGCGRGLAQPAAAAFCCYCGKHLE